MCPSDAQIFRLTDGQSFLLQPRLDPSQGILRFKAFGDPLFVYAQLAVGAVAASQDLSDVLDLGDAAQCARVREDELDKAPRERRQVDGNVVVEGIDQGRAQTKPLNAPLVLFRQG